MKMKKKKQQNMFKFSVKDDNEKKKEKTVYIFIKCVDLTTGLCASIDIKLKCDIVKSLQYVYRYIGDRKSFAIWIFDKHL